MQCGRATHVVYLKKTTNKWTRWQLQSVLPTLPLVHCRIHHTFRLRISPHLTRLLSLTPPQTLPHRPGAGQRSASLRDSPKNQLIKQNKRSIGQTLPNKTHLYLLSLGSRFVSLGPPLPFPLPVPLSLPLPLSWYRHHHLLLCLLLFCRLLDLFLLLRPCVSLLLPLLPGLLSCPLLGLPSLSPRCLLVDLQDGLKKGTAGSQIMVSRYSVAVMFSVIRKCGDGNGEEKGQEGRE